MRSLHECHIELNCTQFPNSFAQFRLKLGYQLPCVHVVTGVPADMVSGGAGGAGGRAATLRTQRAHPRTWPTHGRVGLVLNPEMLRSARALCARAVSAEIYAFRLLLLILIESVYCRVPRFRHLFALPNFGAFQWSVSEFSD